jgi:aminopeptidase N
LLLVNDGDLAYAKIRFDPASLKVAGRHVAGMPDPLARALVWGALWDQVRDAELPASWYIDVVLGGVAGESSSTGMSRLLTQLGTCLDRFTAPARRDEARRRAAERLWDLAVDAAPGSDAQLQLARAYAAHAWSEPQLDRVAELLEGSRTLTGLAVDPDRQWELLAALAAAGRAGQDRIEAQLSADPTNKGHEQAALCRAAIPTPAAKRAAWELAVENQATPNATRRAVIAGFNRVRDPELLRPFAERYFDGLVGVWEASSPDTGGDIAGGLYPAGLADVPAADVLGLTDRFLARLGDRLPPLRRLVVEGRAGVVRALAAQGCDAGAE